MKYIFSFFVFLVCPSIIAFTQNYEWQLENTYDQKRIDAWNINPLGELIVAGQGTLYKLDTDFKVLFSQSEKQFGNINEIDSRHSLKTLVFSENQQMLGFIDNTLSFQDIKIDLSTLNIAYATHVCYSDQSNRFWVYDEQNTRLLQFRESESIIKNSEISNLSAITGQAELTSIVENQNQLFLFYRETGLFVFDYYGSLLFKYDEKEAIQFFPTEQHIYFLKKDVLLRIDRTTGKKTSIKLPVNNMRSFKIFRNNVFFEDKSGLKKYLLIPAE